MCKSIVNFAEVTLHIEALPYADDFNAFDPLVMADIFFNQVDSE